MILILQIQLYHFNMIDLLDEITEIPFDVFWEKYQEVKPGKYNKSACEGIWFYMHEENRLEAFQSLCENANTCLIKRVQEPYQYLRYYQLPF